MTLSNQQRAALRYLAAGNEPSEVASILRGVTVKRLKIWSEDHEFMDALKNLQGDIDAEMTDLLVHGEEQAVYTLLKVMEDACTVTKAGMIPDYKTRMVAAVQFLDRRGNRGKVASVHHVDHDIGALSAAWLSDPGVRDWLDTDGQDVKKALSALPPEDTEEADYEIVSGSGSASTEQDQGAGERSS